MTIQFSHFKATLNVIWCLITLALFSYCSKNILDSSLCSSYFPLRTIFWQHSLLVLQKHSGHFTVLQLFSFSSDNNFPTAFFPNASKPVWAPCPVLQNHSGDSRLCITTITKWIHQVILTHYAKLYIFNETINYIQFTHNFVSNKRSTQQ